ncbi:hypothetical protein [Stieleria varia]|uniref:hypothetical protein n=1 Tax=Stieleria varia TaxID=2528005 RepID=UPI0011B646F6|nr:hypothetical protein [Stieleria varia]
MSEERRLNEGQSSGATDQSSPSLYSESFGANVSSGDRSSVGMIETVPLLRRELRSNESDSADDSADGDWQIDSQSLKRLREIARNASPSLIYPESDAIESSLPRRHTHPRITDAAIASWFGEQTGLIELRSTESIPAGLTLEDSIVDVVLNATVGLHRSVELIAGSRMDSGRSDLGINETRDAVLAAMAGEQSSPIVVPVSEATNSQLSSLVYPGAAIVATGISIAAQRRRLQPKLESSRQDTTSRASQSNA